MQPRVTKSCPKCGYWRMFELQNYREEDVNESPTVAVYGKRIDLLFMVVWLANLFGGKAKVARKRKRVRELREQVLPRATKSLICPQCLEVLERF